MAAITRWRSGGSGLAARARRRSRARSNVSSIEVTPPPRRRTAGAGASVGAQAAAAGRLPPPGHERPGPGRCAPRAGEAYAGARRGGGCATAGRGLRPRPLAAGAIPAIDPHLPYPLPPGPTPVYRSGVRTDRTLRGSRERRRASPRVAWTACSPPSEYPRWAPSQPSPQGCGPGVGNLRAIRGMAHDPAPARASSCSSSSSVATARRRWGMTMEPPTTRPTPNTSNSSSRVTPSSRQRIRW